MEIFQGFQNLGDVINQLQIFRHDGVIPIQSLFLAADMCTSGFSMIMESL